MGVRFQRIIERSLSLKSAIVSRKIILNNDSEKGSNKCKCFEMELWLVDSV